MKNIACIVVTYNRKELLKRCLDAVNQQTYKPKSVYIIDNASIDGTIDSVKEWGYYNCCRNDVCYKYILNEKNEGGAGGFHLGLLMAERNGNYDGYWLMDDDGVPEKKCLECLVAYLGEYHFISPLVVDLDNKERTSFYKCSVADFLKRAKNGLVLGEANPFNGVLFSSELVSKIGLPKKEMFIWGDEHNYMQRTLRAGIQLCTVVSAIHYHPVDRQEVKLAYFGKKIIYTESKWKLYCLVRNNVYNIKIWKKGVRRFVSSVMVFVNYTSYYVLKRKDFSNLLLILDAAICGYFEIWGHQFRYMSIASKR